jgi:hypothetical protein
MNVVGTYRKPHRINFTRAAPERNQKNVADQELQMQRHQGGNDSVVSLLHDPKRVYVFTQRHQIHWEEEQGSATTPPRRRMAPAGVIIVPT